MIPFRDLIVTDRTSETPVYLQITNAITTGIRRGQLRSGLKLPGSREMASILNVHRKTLQNSYDELMAQGWIEITPRKGTFVVKDLPDVKPVRFASSEKPERYPERVLFAFNESSFARFPASNPQESANLILDDGFPDIRLAPVGLLMREYRSLSRLHAFRKYYRYGGARGPSNLLEALSAFLSDTRGLPVAEKNILVTRGAQMGIFIAARLLVRQGDHVVIGEPGYFGAALTLQQAGAVVHRVPVDEQGIDVGSIESLCARRKIRAVYVIPHHHYPTTVTLVPERRIRLLELAARRRFAIIEDDYDYDFHYSRSPVLPMASLDTRGNVIYIGTLTKTFVPSIRIGFMVAPANFIDAAANIRRSLDWQGDSLLEVAIGELYRNGTIGRHIKKSVKLYRERRDYFCARLKDEIGEHVSFKVPEGGMSVWVKLTDCDLKKVAERASKEGLTMGNGTLYNTAGKEYNATRMGFASLTLKEQDKVIEIVRRCL
jgi:GntR family transcriptional regulator / MocR family aminotransferase